MSTNTTKENILEAALKSFIEKGYSGTSISQIAKVAQINQSLIYHHFKSKEDLWCHVKKYCLEEATKDFQSIRHDTLEHFVSDLVDARFSVYARASMRMLVHWQALEANTSQFYENEFMLHPLFDIAHHIKALQTSKLVRADRDYQVLAGVIFGLVSYAFFDFADAFNLADDKRNAYKQLVCEILIQTLRKI